MQKYIDLMRKTGLSKDEINRMFAEMYEVVKKNSNETDDPELDNFINNLILENNKRKSKLKQPDPFSMEQKGDSNVKPSIRDIAKEHINMHKIKPSNDLSPDNNSVASTVGMTGHEVVKMTIEKTKQIFNDANVKEVTKNFFVKIYQGFIDWLTVDEPKTNQKSNKKQEDKQ